MKSKYTYLLIALVVVLSISTIQLAILYRKNAQTIRSLEQEREILRKSVPTLSTQSTDEDLLTANNVLKEKIAHLLRKEKKSSGTQKKEGHNYLTIATGLETGYYIRLGKSLCHALSDTPFHLEVISTPGAAQNIIYVNNNADIAFTQVDSFFFFNDSSATRNLARSTSFLLPISQEVLHIIARTGVEGFPSSDSIAVSDLVGKKVNIGPVGSGVRVSATRIIRIAGIDINSMNIDSSFFLSAWKKLLKGDIDVVMWTMTPSPQLFREHYPHNSQSVKMYSLDQDFLDHVTGNVQFGYSQLLIEKMYPWQQQATKTVGTDTILVIKRSMDYKLVEKLLTLIFQRKKDLEVLDPRWKLLTIEALRESYEKYSRYYHPGVRKFLRKNHK